jgi:hypothetical protein
MMEVGKPQSKPEYTHLLLISSHQQLTSYEFNLRAFVTLHDLGGVIVGKMVKVDEMESLIFTQDTTRDTYPILLEQCIRDSHGVLLVYSITSRASFDHIADHLEIVRKVQQERIPEKSFAVALVGNQCDLGDGQERQVERAEGEKLARTAELTCGFREVSAKTGEGVEEVFYDIIRELQERQVKRSEGEKLATAEVSAKTRKGVKEALYDIVKKVLRKS